MFVRAGHLCRAGISVGQIKTGGFTSDFDTIIVDEEHHVRILEHVSELVASNSANT